MKKVLVLSCTLALAGLSNMAQAAEGQGFVRAEFGNSTVESDWDDGDDSSFALRGGYYFTDNFGVEAFYAHFYEEFFQGLSLTSGYGTEVSGYGLGAVGKMHSGPDNTGFFVSARAGVLFADAEARHGTVSEGSSTGPYFGFGAGYDFSDRFGVSVNFDFQQADLDDTSIDIETLSVGGELRF